MHEMHEEKKKRFRALTKWFRQGLGRKLDRRRDFGEKKVFGLREKWEGPRYLKRYKIGSDLRSIYKKRNSIDQEGIELLSRKKSR